MKVVDTLIAIHSDFHSGSSVALFPNRFMQFQHQNHTPTEKQKEMWRHFEKVTQYARMSRKDKRMIVIHDGDAIDGFRYGVQSVTLNTDEQAEIHVELMDYFLRKTGFKRKSGDKLFYVTGTESHTGDVENKVAKDLSAEKNGELNVFDHLELEVNGRLIWLVHHGPKRGRGALEGNALRNFLRDIYWDAKKTDKRPPDMLITGHVHTPIFNTYVIREKEEYKTISGVICPSYQYKTRFAFKVAPVEVNQIGSVFIEITASGDIRIPKFVLMDSKENETIKV